MIVRLVRAEDAAPIDFPADLESTRELWEQTDPTEFIAGIDISGRRFSISAESIIDVTAAPENA